jgi:hypothetical protein
MYINEQVCFCFGYGTNELILQKKIENELILCLYVFPPLKIIQEYCGNKYGCLSILFCQFENGTDCYHSPYFIF